jgi:hypothetical protein
MPPAIGRTRRQNAKLSDVRAFELRDYDSRPTMSFSELIEAMKASGANINSGAILHAGDDSYPGMSQDELAQYINTDPCAGMIWQPQKRDCDDFAEVFYSGLKARGYGNARVGYVEMTLWDGVNKCVGSHACDVIVFDNGLAKFIEPQTYQLYPLDAVWIGDGIGGSAVWNEIYWIKF